MRQWAFKGLMMMKEASKISYSFATSPKNAPYKGKQHDSSQGWGAAGLASTSMVSDVSTATQTKTSVPQSKKRPTSVAKQSQGNSSNLAQIEPSRLSLIREGLNKYDLSPGAKKGAYGLMERGYLQAIPNFPWQMATIL